MKRTPEPELMNEAEQARAYAEADFTEPNRRFVELVDSLGLEPGARLVDLGCGPAEIPIRLATRHLGWRVEAVDGAPAMLTLAREKRARAGLDDRLRLVEARLSALPLERGVYDGVVSNSLLHHLHDPHDLWRAVVDLGRPGTHVLVMDLRRPASEADVKALVREHAGAEPEILRRDFEASLHAAYTVDEVAEQVAEARLPLAVKAIGDRHLVVIGTLPEG